MTESSIPYEEEDEDVAAILRNAVPHKIFVTETAGSRRIPYSADLVLVDSKRKRRVAMIEVATRDGTLSIHLPVQTIRVKNEKIVRETSFPVAMTVMDGDHEFLVKLLERADPDEIQSIAIACAVPKPISVEGASLVTFRAALVLISDAAHKMIDSPSVLYHVPCGCTATPLSPKPTIENDYDPSLNPFTPLIAKCKPTGLRHSHEHKGKIIVRPERLNEIIRAFRSRNQEFSAHERIAAIELLRTCAEKPDAHPATKEATWRSILGDENGK
jgi:hypothetical protein